MVEDPTAGTAPGYSAKEWADQGPGLLLEVIGGGALVFEEPNDDTLLLQRRA